MIEQASLVIGNDNFAVKENSFLGYALNQGFYVPREMDVVRATTATLVNSDGLIEPVAYNLLSYSEQLNNAIWTKTAATINANATIAPNGTLTADKLIEDSTNATHLALQSISFISQSSNYNYSVYLKAAERYKFRLRFGGFGSATDINGDLNAQTVSAGTLTNVGNGWFRCEFSVNSSTGVTSPFIVVSLQDNSGNNNYLGNGTSGLFVWGAQVTGGSTVKTYFPTTDRLDVPRVDYSNGTPSILVEPQRTNLVLRSEEFDNASWVRLGTITVTSNNSISPSGNSTADLVLGADATSSISQIIAGTTGLVYTNSFYIKNNNSTQSRLTIRNTITAVECNINWSGTVLSSITNLTGTTTFQDIGNNWYRITSTYTSLEATQRPRILPTQTTNQSVFLWGAQVEVGSNATSYIPTVAASVTRNADVISKTGISSLIGQTEGTLFLDYNLLNFLNQEVTINNVYTNSISLGFLTDTTFKFRCLFFSNSISTNLTSGTISALGNYKIAVKYKSGENKLFINGVLVASNTSTLNFTTSLNSLFLNTATAVYFGNNSKSLKSMAIWKTQLTDQECIDLTKL
jgi:hypothetical protein